MKRRELIIFVSGAVAWPLAAHAQQHDRVRRVGVFSGLPNEAIGQLYFKAFKGRLQELGWIEGRNLNLVYRWAAGNPDRVRDLASEMVAANPDAILAMTTPALSALRRQTPTIPLVLVNVSDPDNGGFVESIARPGGNITGFTSFEDSIGGKWLMLLKEAAPSMERVLVLLERVPVKLKHNIRRLGRVLHETQRRSRSSVLGLAKRSTQPTGPEGADRAGRTADHISSERAVNPENYTSRAVLRTVETVAPSIGVRAIPVEVRGSAEIESAINEFGRQPNGGRIEMPHCRKPLTWSSSISYDASESLAGARYAIESIEAARVH